MKMGADLKLASLLEMNKLLYMSNDVSRKLRTGY